MDLNIREAKREDCPEILRLLQELADFENMSDQSKLTLNDLQRDGFDCEHPLFQCLLVEDRNGSNAIVGYALYYFTYTTWTGKSLHLEDFYVPVVFRKQGIGAALFAAVAKRARDSGCKRMDFIVLDWNPARNFYATHGAEDLSEKEGWHMYCVQDEALVTLANKDTVICSKNIAQ